MGYETLDTINISDGTYTLFTYAAGAVPILVPLILFGIFCISVLGSYFMQINLRNSGDFPASFAAGAFVTVVVAQTMALISNLVSLGTLVTCYGLAILGAIFLYSSRPNNGY